jgi:hypothetical protein
MRRGVASVAPTPLGQPVAPRQHATELKRGAQGRQVSVSGILNLPEAALDDFENGLSVAGYDGRSWTPMIPIRAA